MVNIFYNQNSSMFYNMVGIYYFVDIVDEGEYYIYESNSPEGDGYGFIGGPFTTRKETLEWIASQEGDNEPVEHN